jgi:HAE1 family hydrophobic/amphiphilic exporter-1
MWISDFSINNRVVTTVLMLALVVFGAIALWRLDTDEFPEVSPPVVAVTIPYPGGSPDTVEREVVDPLEDAFAAISGIKRISTSSMDSLAVLTVEFEFSKDLQQASQDIRDKISEIRRDLPDEMEEPVLTRFDPADLPIVSLTLSSPQRSQAELTQLADPELVDALRAVPGVADAKLVGARERELTVELHPEALIAAHVGVAQVVQALGVQNLAAPVGRLNDKWSERAIRLRGRLAGPKDFEQLVVAGSGQNIVRLGQLATVRDGSAEPRSGAFYDEKPAVGVDVVKSHEYSTTTVSGAVRERAQELQAQLPKDVKLTVVSDAGVRVAHSVSDVELSLLLGAGLTVLVVFLFLNSWRSTVITGLALPVSVLSSFIAVWAFGFTLNTMSLLGLSLAIGMLIDDAIVVRENIVRHMEMGKGHLQAAREGTAEIGLAVAATTFSIVVVFVPIAFMGGVAQQWFAPFALTIAASVLVSLFVSFSLDPMLSSVWADPAVESGQRGRIGRLLERFNAFVDRLTERYKRMIRWALGHRLAMAALAVASLVVALALPATGVLGSEFFPEQDRSEFRVELRAPPAANLEYTRAKALEASAQARELPEVMYTYAALGGTSGESVDEASIYVKLLPKAKRSRGQAEISRELRERLSRLAGVQSAISNSSFNPRKQIQIEVRGPDLKQLTALAERLAAAVKTVPGATDVGLSSKGQKPELEVTLDRDLASGLAVTAADVAQALRPAFAGIDAGDWVDPSGETRDVMVRLLPEARVRRADLESLPVQVGARTGAPTTVPLGQLARVQSGLGPAVINHVDRDRVVVVEANTVDRPLTQVIQDIDKKVEALSLPAGYSVTQGGETKDQREVFGRILLALGVAVMLMYLVLVVQFSSFLEPLAIMASLPLSLVGVSLGLLLTGSTVNLMSLIGVILLMGIVAKNAILLIDFAKWSEKSGKSREDAIVEAGGVRLRPILMTTLAIVAGMLPVAIGFGEGADFRAPLGRAVIGGVITSTLLTLLVIPTFYDVLANARDNLFARLRRKAPAELLGGAGERPITSE